VTTRPLRAFFLCLLALFCAGPAMAVDFPPLSGRVVDQAELLDPGQEAALVAKLEALERASSRQLVVATIPSLQDLTIEEFGHQLARHWRIGQEGANNGIVLIIAPNERRMRIEVGYGLEGIMTDALSTRIIRETITPRFKANPPDYAGGIDAGADAIIEQLQAAPEAAEQRALAAARAESGGSRARSGDRSPFPLIVWSLILLFVFLPLLGAGLHGRRYRGRGRRGVSIWGPGRNRDGSGVGWFLAGIALDSIARGGGSSWGGGGSSWGGGGGGGFSGGGGSFGGGGASGGW